MEALIKEINRIEIEAQQQAQRGDWEHHRDTINHLFGLKHALQILSNNDN